MIRDISLFFMTFFFFSFLILSKIDDHCRVRLSVQNSHPHSDYINANFVPVRLILKISILKITIILAYTCMRRGINVYVAFYFSGWGNREGLHLHPGSAEKHRG